MGKVLSVEVDMMKKKDDTRIRSIRRSDRSLGYNEEERRRREVFVRLIPYKNRLNQAHVNSV